jgi:hypothetical protein
MLRNNGGNKQYYGDPKWNIGEGRGDLREVFRRRTWDTVDYWQSDERLIFAKPVQNENGEFVQNEWFYVGRTTKGVLDISSITVKGRDARFFTVSKKKAKIRQEEFIRIQVSFSTSERISLFNIQAYIEIRNNVNKYSLVRIARDSDSSMW